MIMEKIYGSNNFGIFPFDQLFLHRAFPLDRQPEVNELDIERTWV